MTGNWQVGLVTLGLQRSSGREWCVSYGVLLEPVQTHIIGHSEGVFSHRHAKDYQLLKPGANLANINSRPWAAHRLYGIGHETNLITPSA